MYQDRIKKSQASVLLKGLGHEMTICWKDKKLSQHFLDMRKCFINVQTALLKDEVLTLFKLSPPKTVRTVSALTKNNDLIFRTLVRRPL